MERTLRNDALKSALALLAFRLRVVGHALHELEDLLTTLTLILVDWHDNSCYHDSTMSNKTTLLLAPALAPLTGTQDPHGCAVRDLARALQQSGWQVTIVVGIDASVDTNRVGLARRLEPLSVGGSELVVHEGNIESGDIRLIAIGGVNRPRPGLCLQAALTMVDLPEVLQLWSATRNAISAFPEVFTEDNTPAVVVHLAQAVSTTEAIREQLAHADLLLLSSKTAANEQRRAKNSTWGPLKEKIYGLAPGYDDREWNPARDSLLTKRMDPPDSAVKADAKSALRAELGLKEDDLPLIGVVAETKDLTRDVAAALLELPVQFAGIDAGAQMQSMASRSPLRAASPRLVSDYEQKQLRHRIVAAADFILTPGEASPISQLYPCRYGTAVIAPKRGEFAERLANFDLRTLTGAGFLYQEDHEIVNAVRQAVSAWHSGEETRHALIERCLQIDQSWSTAALRLGELLEA